MATKDCVSSENDKHQQSFGNAHDNIDKKFTNLNLNQNFKSSDSSSVHSDSKIKNSDKKFEFFTYFHKYEYRRKRRETAAPSKKLSDSSGIENNEGKPGLQTWKKSSLNSFEEDIREKIDDLKDFAKKDNSLNATNNSTLSLHIAAYENLNDDTEIEYLKKKNEALFEKGKKVKQMFTEFAPVIKNQFEFSRQQKDQQNEPEVMQFKASQKLFNPNSSENPNERATSGKNGKSSQDTVAEKSDGDLIILKNELFIKTMSKKPFNFFAGDAKKHTQQQSSSSNGTTNGSSSSSFSRNRNTMPIFESIGSSNSVPTDSLPSQSNGNLRTLIMEAIRTISNSDPALIESLKQSILELLLSERSIDSIQDDLFNALGVENFELISQILSQREQVVQVLVDTSDGGSGNGNIASSAVEHHFDNNPRQSTPINDFEEDSGIPMSNFIVQTKSQAKQRKENRKDQKRAYREVNKVIAGLGETDKLEYQLALKEHQRRMDRQFTEVEWTSNGLATRPRNLPGVFDAFEAAGLKSISVDSTKMCLPEGTEFKKTKEYEEIRVPPTPQTIPIEVKKIQVKDLDPLGKLGFEGFKELNIIQSIVFEQAYHTLENLLICAPTGAGKTNIAMLSVLKTIRDHCKPDGTIDKNDFKIIYIAPMKALAAEMTANFSKRLSKLGLKVRELTGDTTLTKKEIAETQMLVLTP
uniref:Helicase ATP-binding domain-containing protein n=1 Tax=Panagrolaimus sp. ES5 TaxID=591445 RepID=A0AC34FYA4_9BILA